MGVGGVSKMKNVSGLAAVLAALVLGACASTNSEMADGRLIDDPFEHANRGAFEFNADLYRWIVAPVLGGIESIVPDVVEERAADFSNNLRTPVWFANEVLQGDFNGAGNQVKRFAINSTLGFGGLFDVAEDEFGIEMEREDFGQTLAVWGVAEGPYLVLPFIGPTTFRDLAGSAVDVSFDPLSWPDHEYDDEVRIIRFIAIGAGRDRMEAGIERIARANDPYVAARAYWVQNRRAEILEAEDDYEDLPDFD